MRLPIPQINLPQVIGRIATRPYKTTISHISQKLRFKKYNLYLYFVKMIKTIDIIFLVCYNEL